MSSKRCYDLVTDMIPQHLSNIIWAYSKFGLRPMPSTLDVLKQVSGGLIRKMSPQMVANMLYGYAALPCTATYDTCDAVMSEVPLAESLRRAVTDMIPRRLSDIIWAYSKFGLRPMPETLDALKQVAGGLIREMSPQMVANTLYGYVALPRTATCDTRDVAMSEVSLAELEAAIQRVAPDMNSQAVTNTIWAYGTLGVPPKRGVIDELEAALRRMVADMIPQ